MRERIGTTAAAQAPISVVVPTYNDAGRLARLLRSLEGLSPAPAEVLVVDDGSRDRTPSLLREWAEAPHSFLTRVVDARENGGPARARNLGTRMATQPLVAFTDTDCEVDAPWLGAFDRFFRDAGQNVSGAGGRIQSIGTDWISRYMVINGILEPWPQDGRPILYVVTANACFRRDRLIEVGGFDERIRQAGGEDPGLCFKLLQAGYELGMAEAAVVRHDFRSGLWPFIKTFYRYGRGCRYVSDRCLPRGLGTGAPPDGLPRPQAAAAG